MTTLSALAVGMFALFGLLTEEAAPFAVALTAIPPAFVLLVAGRALPVTAS